MKNITRKVSSYLDDDHCNTNCLFCSEESLEVDGIGFGRM